MTGIEGKISRKVLHTLTIDDTGSEPVAGIGTVSTVGLIVTGIGTSFLTSADIRADISDDNEERYFTEITSDTVAKIDRAFTADLTASTYGIRKYIDQSKVVKAISDADTLIDMYLVQTGATVPLTDVPEIVVLFSEGISIYNLFFRRGLIKDRDDVVLQEYERILKMLRDIAMGVINLDITSTDIPNPAENVSAAVFISPGDRLLSRAKTKGFF